MSKINFLKELLKANSNNVSGDPDLKKKFTDLEKGIMDSFLKNLPEETQREAKQLLKNNSLIEIIQAFDKESDGKTLEIVEGVLDKMSDQDVLVSEHFNLDPVDLHNKYHELKVKYNKYQESEDINNF